MKIYSFYFLFSRVIYIYIFTKNHSSVLSTSTFLREKEVNGIYSYRLWLRYTTNFTSVGFRFWLEVSCTYTRTEELLDNATVCLQMTIYIYIYIVRTKIPSGFDFGEDKYYFGSN